MQTHLLTDFKGRPVQNACFAVFFVVCNVIAIAFQSAFIYEGHFFLKWATCYANVTGSVDEDIANIIEKGVGGLMRNGGGIVLTETVALVFLFSIIWVYALRRCAKTVVFGSYFSGILGTLACIFYVKNHSMAEWTDSIVLYPLLGVCIAVIMIIVKRESINRAAVVISLSCTALEESPSLFIFNFLLVLLQLLYIVFYMASAVSVYFAYPIYSSNQGDSFGNANCGYSDLSQGSWVVTAAYFSSSIFLWNIFFGDSLRLFVTSGVMGVWFFNENPLQSHNQIASGHSFAAALLYVKLALSKQLGTVALASLIVAAIHRLKQWATSHGCCLCCPHVILAKIVFCVIEQCAKMMTRYGLAYAALCGNGFVAASRESFSLVIGSFGDAVVNELTASVVLNVGVLVFSYSVGAIVWAALDVMNHQVPFSMADAHLPFDIDAYETLVSVLRTVMLGFSGWVAYHTLLALFLLILLPSLWTYTLGSSAYLGVLAMVVARLLMSFVAGLIHDSTTSLYLCAALDKQRNTLSSKRALMEAMLRADNYANPVLLLDQSAPTPVMPVYVPPEPQYAYGMPPPPSYPGFPPPQNYQNVLPPNYMHAPNFPPQNYQSQPPVNMYGKEIP